MKKVKLGDIKIKIAGFKTEFKPKEKKIDYAKTNQNI